MKSITRFAATLAALFAPALAFAQGYTQTTNQFFWGGTSIGGTGVIGGCTSNICEVATTVITIINNVLVPVLFAIAFIVFLYGIARAYIFSGGDAGKVAEGHKLLLWGLVAFVVMISIWGLVNVVANTFGLGGYYAPVLPTSY